jgi:lipid A 4'-phosphatase
MWNDCMNRLGIVSALTVALVVGLVFAVYPQLDIDIAALFFNSKTRVFIFIPNRDTGTERVREAMEWLIALLAAPAIFALLGKFILPHRRMLIPGRAAMFLALTLALGPGIIANLLLKEHWGRARPVLVTQFGGTERFTPWWDPRGSCSHNCSFIAGEPAGAFWTLAPASFAPPQWRVIAYGAALAFGMAVSVLRMAAGGHFFTDIVFAGVITFLVVWAVHGLIYRWRLRRKID